MALSFKERLDCEYRRRDAAMQRMHSACDFTRSAMKQETEGLKQDLSPRTIVREHQWSFIAGSAALGFGLVALVARMKKHRAAHVHHVAGGPQHVVVEVVGAKPAHEEKKRNGSMLHAWKQIFDAAATGIPAVMAFLQKFDTKVEHNGGGSTPEGEEFQPETAPAIPRVEEKQGTPFSKSISRRTAPPPRES